MTVRSGRAVGTAVAVLIGGVLAGGMSTVPATAAPDLALRKAPRPGAWQGTATNMDRTFNYGAVSFTVVRGAISNFVIEGVTVSGCGGYKSIVVPRLTISGKKVSGSYVPIEGIDDVIIVTGSFAGGAIRGTFTEGPTCIGAGRFIARPS